MADLREELKTDIAKLGLQRNMGLAVGKRQEDAVRDRLNRVLVAADNRSDTVRVLEKSVAKLLGEEDCQEQAVKLAGIALEKLQLLQTPKEVDYRKLVADAASCTDHGKLKELLLNVADDSKACVNSETLACADALVEVVDEVQEALEMFLEKAYPTQDGKTFVVDVQEL